MRAPSLASLTKRDARALLEVVMKTDGCQDTSEWLKRSFAVCLFVRISGERR